jgi:hypothetical protein
LLRDGVSLVYMADRDGNPPNVFRKICASSSGILNADGGFKGTFSPALSASTASWT